MVELGKRRGDLETLVQDDFLALKPNISGPFHEASQVASGLDVSACQFQTQTKKRIRTTIHFLAAPPFRVRVHSPIPKFLGVASKSGFLVVLDALEVANGAGAGFFEDFAFGGCLWVRSLRRNRQHAIHQSPSIKMERDGEIYAGFGALVPTPLGEWARLPLNGLPYPRGRADECSGPRMGSREYIRTCG